MKLLLTVTLLFPIASAIQAQTLGIDTITCNSLKAINNNTVVSIHNTFVVYGSSRIDWMPADAAETWSYQVTETAGAWTDLNQPGQVEFKVKLGSREGSVFLYRNAQGMRIRIDMYRGSVSLVPFEFIISGYTTN